MLKIVILLIINLRYVFEIDEGKYLDILNVRWNEYIKYNDFFWEMIYMCECFLWLYWLNLYNFVEK